jgi:hypothetical protein
MLTKTKVPATALTILSFISFEFNVMSFLQEE